MSDPVLGSAAFCRSLPIAVRSRRIAHTYLILICFGTEGLGIADSKPSTLKTVIIFQAC
ncbi:hypothetical protein FIBSPDRAFT_854859, partial [Athelia psychrophila]